jgi:UDP-N-acetylglucosamine:LPS N-acetylglucosamine transferase
MISEDDLNGESLAERIAYLASHPDILAAIGRRVSSHGKPEAAASIVDACFGVMAARGIPL